MADRGDNSAYIRNLLGLLDLQLFSRLDLCPEGSLGEAHDRIVQVAAAPDGGGFAADEQEIAACRRILAELQARQKAILDRAGADLSAEILRDRFGLEADEVLLLTAVIAPAVDERFRRIYRLFQGGEEPRMDFLLSLLEPDGIARYGKAPLLGRDGTLLSRGLVTMSPAADYPLPAAVFRPAPGLLEWLNGVRSTAVYAGRAEYCGLPDLRTRDEAFFASIAAAVRTAGNSHEAIPLVSFYGPDSELLMEYAEALAVEMGQPLLKLNLAKTDIPEAIPLLRTVLRDSVLNGALPVIYGFDPWIDAGGVLPAEIGAFFADWNTPLVLLSSRQTVFPMKEVSKERLILRMPVEGLKGSQRFTVWKRYLADLTPGGELDDEELRTLAGQFTLSTAQIRSAVNSGLEIAVAEERDLCLKDLYEGARLSSMHHLSDLAKKIPSRYTIRDLILPEKQAAEIDSLIAMARNRSLVLEDWEVGKKLVTGRGISALFTGAPGTGKTLSAQVIAGELGLELYRVDLSTIISKYIGETEKNLERIFTEAQNSNVILFFDEADSLFGRRSEVNDAHDRYANIEVGYLLQRIETYDGIVLMATNLGANLDEAFARRIHFIIDFPFPDDDTRLRLWKLLLPENIEKEEIDLEPFAAFYKIAGGNIRNAVVWAIYAAARNKAPLTREDLLHGIEREYQKMGKVFIPIR